MSTSTVTMAVLELLGKMSGWELDSLFLVIFVLPMSLNFILLFMAFRMLRDRDVKLDNRFDKIEADHDQIRECLSQCTALIKNDFERFDNVGQRYDSIVRDQRATMDNLLELVKQNVRAMEIVGAKLDCLLRSA